MQYDDHKLEVNQFLVDARATLGGWLLAKLLQKEQEGGLLKQVTHMIDMEGNYTIDCVTNSNTCFRINIDVLQDSDFNPWS